MKKKKGIILLVTLFFIIAITSIYLKNLDDTKKLVDASQNKYNLNYTMKILEDLNSIVENLNKTYELYTDDGFEKFFEKLPSSAIPINFENILINAEFEKLEFKCDINDIYDSNESAQITCIDVFNNHSINMVSFIDTTKSLYLQEENNITNHKQKDYIIDTFIENSSNDYDDSIKEDITFLKDTNSSNYLKCSYEININENTINTINAIYKLDENGTKVEDIEISYK